MKTIFLAAGVLASSLTLAAPPAMAVAPHQPHAYARAARHHDHHGYAYHRRSAESCRRARHRSANTGTVLGVIGGGVIGSQLAGGGSRTLGTLIGAGAGGVIGHQVGAHAHRCR